MFGLVALIISSCKRLISPPGKRNEDHVKVTGATIRNVPPGVVFSLLWTPDATNENAQVLHLLTRGSALSWPIIQHVLAVHSNEKQDYCRILCLGIQSRGYSISWICSHKCTYAKALWDDLWRSFLPLTKFDFLLFFACFSMSNQIEIHIKYFFSACPQV